MYAEHIKVLYDAFSDFYDEAETLDDVRAEFSEVQAEIMSNPGWKSLKYHELWARMLVHRYER